jgi:hypothetical protein
MQQMEQIIRINNVIKYCFEHVNDVESNRNLIMLNIIDKINLTS